MRQFIAALLIAFLSTPAFADVATERDKTKKGAVIGGVAGAIGAGCVGEAAGGAGGVAGGLAGWGDADRGGAGGD